MFIPQAQPHAQSLFLFPIVFGINLIHFFDISTRKNGAAGNSIVCFAASIPCQCHLTVRRMRTVSKSATFLATESVNSAPFKRGETEVQNFWQGIAQNSSSILRCTFLARRSAKLIANFSATMVTSLPSFSLSLSLSLYLSLSLSPNVPHAQYRKRFRASYNTEREREREIDGSDVIIVALKLAMSLHFPMPKNSHNCWEFTLPLQKIRTFRFSLHTSCLSFLKWSSLWRWNSQWVHTYRCQKNSPSLFRLCLEWREPRDEWSKTQEKWSNSAQSHCSSHRKNELN